MPDAPRVEPLAEAEWSDAVREILEPLKQMGGGHVLNIFTTLAHHPDLMRRWLVFGNHVLGKSTLPPREREIAILRIGWLCRSAYEWGQHVIIARGVGMTDEDIARVAAGPDAAGWTEAEALIVRATDELHEDARIGDATWAAITKHFDRQQCMDLVFAVGQYNLVSMALNTFGVVPDAGVPGFDETT
jgi:alkylhydroperoxidase family enzyme